MNKRTRQRQLNIKKPRVYYCYTENGNSFKVYEKDKETLLAILTLFGLRHAARHLKDIFKAKKPWTGVLTKRDGQKIEQVLEMLTTYGTMKESS